MSRFDSGELASRGLLPGTLENAPHALASSTLKFDEEAAGQRHQSPDQGCRLLD